MKHTNFERKTGWYCEKPAITKYKNNTNRDQAEGIGIEEIGNCKHIFRGVPKSEQKKNYRVSYINSLKLGPETTN